MRGEKNYARGPSALLLLLAAGACSAYAVLTAPRPAAPHGGGQGPAEAAPEAPATEAAPVPGCTMEAAEACEREGRYGDAATCYEQVLVREPYRRDAMFRCALALSRAEEAGRLLAFMKGLVYDEPKLAAELFRHPDLAALASEPVFRPLVAEARAQAND